MPLRRLGVEAEVSAAIVFLLSPAAAFITGVTLQIDGAASLGSEIFPLGPDGEVGALRRLPPRRDARRAEVMPALHSQLDPRSAAFAANAAAHGRSAWPRCARCEAKVVAESSSKRAKFEARGQLLPRERVARLIDRGSEFLELSPLAGLGMHDDDGKKSVQGGGSIVGIGVVAGKRVLVSASDSAVKGGTVAPMGLKKALRAQELARENKLPLIALVESGGANLMYQAEIFVDGGRTFANQARLSAAGIPQIAVVHGASTAGGAYLPGLSDYVVLVRGRSSIYLAGPPLVKAAIGEDATEEELGGAETHAEVTGLGEYLTENDAHAIALARELIDKLPWDTVPRAGRRACAAVRRRGTDGRGARRRARALRRARGHRPPRRRLRLPRIQGRPTPPTRSAATPASTATRSGLIGNNGPIQPAGSHQGGAVHPALRPERHAAGLPAEHHRLHGRQGGRAGRRHQARQQDDPGRGQRARAQVHRRARRQLRRRQLRHVRPRLRPALHLRWPSARTAVMGGAQAAKVMDIVNRNKLERLGLPANDEALAAMSDALRQRLDAESAALFGTARLWDDGIIDPRDTRRILGLCLAIAREAEARTLRPNTFGVARL